MTSEMWFWEIVGVQGEASVGSGQFSAIASRHHSYAELLRLLRKSHHRDTYATASERGSVDDLTLQLSCYRLLRRHLDTDHTLPLLESFWHRAAEQHTSRTIHERQLVADLCYAYRNTSGPSTAAKRLSLVTQAYKRSDNDLTLGQLNTEHVYALWDHGQHAEAIERANELLQQQTLSHPDELTLLFALSDFAIAHERYQDALGYMHAHRGVSLDASHSVRSRIQITRILAAQGSAEAAIRAFPRRAQVEHYPSLWEPWCRGLYALIAGSHIGLQQDACHALVTWGKRLLRRGARWPASHIFSRMTALHLGCGNRFAARASFDLLEPYVDEFSPAALAALHLESLESALQESSVQSATNTESATAMDFDALVAMHRSAPERADLTQAVVEHWQALGHHAEAIRAYERSLQHQVRMPIEPLGTLYAQEERFEELASLLDSRPDFSPAPKAFFRSILCERQGDIERALAHVSSGPSHLKLDERRVSLLCDHDRHAEALLFLNHRATSNPASALDWERIRIGTRLGRWDAVRDSAKRLSIPLQEATGPIEEEWEHILVQYPDDRILIARRTGPVTAKILPVMGDDERERHGEVVLIHPVPHADVREADTPALHRVDQVLTPSRWSGFSLRGVHPGHARVNEMRAALERLGFAHWEWSQSHTILPNGQPMLYLAVAVPEDSPSSRLYDYLQNNAPASLIWTRLMELHGTPDDIQAMESIRIDTLQLRF